MPTRRRTNCSRGRWAVATAWLALLAPAGATADERFNGIEIGTPLRALTPQFGRPTSVATEDSGNLFVFRGGLSAYADDDGRLLAVALQAGTARVAVDGVPCSFALGSYSAARADAELADVAEFSTPALRSYRLAPRRDLILAFASSSRLERVLYGEPGQLARLGLLPGDPAAKAVVYRAPRPRTAFAGGSADAAGGVYRMTVDRRGRVAAVDVALASDSTAADAAFLTRLRSLRFVPATLDGRPIGATFFVEAQR